MINGRRVILAVICGLSITVSVNAGMIPVYQEDAGCRQIHSVCTKANLFNDNLSNSYNFPGVTDLTSLPEGFLPQANINIEETSETRHLQSLTNGPGSLNLCLSALIGLGLCSSAHFVKKLSFSFVPEWYHNGGPFQVGHSLAVSPKSLCPEAVCCFAEPIKTAEDSFIKYSLMTIVSFWRKSHFTLGVIASRGPPSNSLLR